MRKTLAVAATGATALAGTPPLVPLIGSVVVEQCTEQRCTCSCLLLSRRSS